MPPSPFQNNVTALDDIAYDNSGFFVVADYIEHLKSCFRLAMQFYSHSLSIKRHHPDGVNAIYNNVYIQVICTCFIYILYIMHVTYSLFPTKQNKRANWWLLWCCWFGSSSKLCMRFWCWKSWKCILVDKGFNFEHFSFRNPNQLSDHTPLTMSCLTEDLMVIKPYAVHGGYPGIKKMKT